MAFTLNSERQYTLVARVPFDFADFGATGVGELAVRLPINSIVTGGGIAVTTAFDGTTPTADVGDGTTADRYLAAGDVSSAGYIPLVPTGYVTGDGDDVTVELNWTDTTAGAGFLVVEYIRTDRGNEAQPN